MKKATLRSALLLVLCLTMCAPVLLMSQTAPVRFDTKRVEWNSGMHDGQRGGAARAYVGASRIVDVPQAGWLRLIFADAFLGSRSYLTITSLEDGALQRLDAQRLWEWGNSSAYFNGDAVEIKLFVAPGDRDVFVRLRQVQAGEGAGDVEPLTQCGPTDDRVPSTDPRAGRMLNVGCTGWIVDNGLQATAGHCSGGSLNVMQFNVPQSNPNGSLNMPGPQDQYSVDPSTKKFVNGGIGNDWGVFQVFDNSQTGLQPIEAQGAAFTVVQDLGPANIRITGYGTDNTPLTRNQTEQTSFGPNAGSVGTTMRYKADTEGGNSGSPVIDEATNRAVGVHTNGGCSTTGAGSNSGTATFNTAFWDALNPAILVKATPLNPPIIIPPSGGQFNFDVVLTNVSNQSVSFQFWTYAKRSTGGITDALFGPQNITLNAGQTMTLNLAQVIPVVDAGSFTYYCAAGALPNTFIFQDTFNFQITAASPSRFAQSQESGAWKAYQLSGAGDAFEAGSAVIPDAITLEANYPNPFNPTTIIRYGLNEPTQVRLAIFNTLGQKVRTVVDAFQPAGMQSVTWDATDDAGRAVSAGVYLYKLEAGATVKTMKMTLTK